VSDAAGIARGFVHRVLVAVGATGSTLGLFLVLPLMKSIAKPPPTDLVVQSFQTAELAPPPPPPEEEPEEEPEPEDEPLELAEEAPPLDLAQLELALGDAFGGEGALGAELVAKLTTVGAAGRAEDVDALFSLADLDQEPRVLHQPSPVLDAPARKKTPGSVTVLFVVDQRGRVESPVVQKSSDPALERAALNAVKQWKFEPGKRNGEPVRFRMRVPITFPKG
jgi:protein TonB